jgi:hypothetical protein
MIFFISTVLEIIIPGVALFIHQVTQDGGLDIDLERIAPESSERYHADLHFPAMEIAVNADVGGSNLFGFKIITGIKADLPFGRKAEISPDPE